ncbi:MAG TPA: DEAD/DEAH box helicase [Chloroflexota bacterium]|nr:DEAD/DEAH box helicase [Chloroflexota bacterium]
MSVASSPIIVPDDVPPPAPIPALPPDFYPAPQPSLLPAAAPALRPYQEEAVTAIHNGLLYGIRRSLAVLPTGAGKTVVLAEVIRRLGGPALILAPRKELQQQALTTLARWCPDSLRAAAIGRGADPLNARHLDERAVRTTSVQRLAANEGLLATVRAIPWSIVVVDECHHAMADTWIDVLRRLGCASPRGPRLLGLTATPYRHDGKSLLRLFEQQVYEIGIGDLIGDGFLVPAHGITVRIEADFATLATTMGDYDPGALGRMLSLTQAPDRIAEAFLTHGRGRPTLAFTPTRAVGAELVAALTIRGVRASLIHGGEPKGRRERLLRQFHDGVWEVLVNATLLTEGYDEPKVSCILLARPTTSLALFLQIIGRGLRPHDQKSDCLVIDVTGADTNPSAISLDAVFGPGGPGQLSPAYQARRRLATGPEGKPNNGSVRPLRLPSPAAPKSRPGQAPTTTARGKGAGAAGKGRSAGAGGSAPKVGGAQALTAARAEPEGGRDDDPSADDSSQDMLPFWRDYVAQAALVSIPIELFRRTQAIHAIEVAGSPTRLKLIAVAEQANPIREGIIKIAQQRDGWLVALDWSDGTRDLHERGIPEEAHAMLHAARLADRIGPRWLITTSEPWRQKPATESARRHARNLGIRVTAAATAGQVSDAITLKRALDGRR